MHADLFFDQSKQVVNNIDNQTLFKKEIISNKLS